MRRRLGMRVLYLFLLVIPISIEINNVRQGGDVGIAFLGGLVIIGIIIALIEIVGLFYRSLRYGIIVHPRGTAAFFLALPIGAIIGVAFAFATRGNSSSLLDWIDWRSGDAMIWGVAGAIMAGGATCLYGVLRKRGD